MKKLALIGKNILHSKSQKVYESILNEKVNYTLLDIPAIEKIPRLDELFEMFDGVSITAPYKNAFDDRLLVQDASIQHLNSINCLRKREGHYEGTSTDFFALQDHFNILKKEYGCFRVILLGDGSMSRMTRFILRSMEMECKVFSRKLGNLTSQTSLDTIFPSDKKTIIVNSCWRDFIFAGKVPGNALFWDYNYDIAEHTKYIREKCSYKDGYSLLQLQAKYALDFWYGQ